MTKFEYIVKRVQPSYLETPSKLEAMLNSRGEQGWEYISMVPAGAGLIALVYKREIIVTPQPKAANPLDGLFAGIGK